MAEESISHKITLKNIDETSEYFTEEIRENELMSKKHKKNCTILNHIKRLLILASVVSECIRTGITICAVRIKICAITARVKK